MKVCHMTSAHGAEDIRIFHKECVSLAQAGHEVILVERGDSYEKNGVRIVGVGEIPGGRLKRMTQGAKRVYQAALETDADLYHFHDPELLPYALKLKRAGKKVIFDSHEYTRMQILTRDYLPRWAAKIVSALYGLYEDRAVRKLDGVIFPCPMSGKFPFRCRRTLYLDNYPRLEELYDKYDPDAQKEAGTLCLIGSLTYVRGVQHLLRAVDRAGCRALVGGKIVPASFADQLQQTPGYERTSFLGVLNREEVLSVLRKVQIGVSAPLNIGQYDVTDNLSTKCCEYMSMGLPVILTRHAFNERMLAQYRFGICVDPENTEEYASAIRTLLDDPELARRMGENGRKLIREQLNWEAQMPKLLALYAEVEKGSAT